jgi:hypothetical protein
LAETEWVRPNKTNVFCEFFLILTVFNTEKNKQKEIELIKKNQEKKYSSKIQRIHQK